MRWLTLLFGALLTDLVLREVFLFEDLAPDVLLCGVLFLTLRRPLGEAYTLAFISGMVWDVIYLDPLGMHAFLFVGAAMITTQLKTILWARFVISRFFIGFLMSAAVRFGEVIFWLSIPGNEVPLAVIQGYIISGALTTGVLLACIPWQSKPIQLSKPSPQVVFSDYR